MNDVLIKYSELGTLVTRLKAIIDEFEQAGDRSNQIRDAIKTPWSHSELANKASDAESRWDYKRGKLTESLASIYEAAEGIHKAFADFDEQAAAKFEAGEEPPA